MFIVLAMFYLVEITLTLPRKDGKEHSTSYWAPRHFYPAVIIL